MEINTNIDVTKKFDNGLVAICKSKTTVTLNNPAYVGMCILDLSKVLMYEYFIMIILKTDMVTNRDYYSLALIV